MHGKTTYFYAKVNLVTFFQEKNASYDYLGGPCISYASTAIRLSLRVVNQMEINDLIRIPNITKCFLTLLWHRVLCLSLLHNFIHLSLSSGSAQVQFCSRCVRDSWWWGSLTMVPTENKTKRLSSVNHTTKIIHHHHPHHHHFSVLPLFRCFYSKGLMYYLNRLGKPTNFLLFCSRYTNADLKTSLYLCSYKSKTLKISHSHS